MRLPQSSRPPVSIRVVSITFLITLAIGLPTGARAATQQLVSSPPSLRFGTVTLGQSETQLIALTNTGQTSATLSGISVNGSEFSVSSLNFPVVLAAGQSVNLRVTFAPTVGGWTLGTATVTSNASNPNLRLGIAGTGVSSEALTAAPASLLFGQVPVGTSATIPVVLTNARTSKETLSEFRTVGSGFSVSGPTLPLTLSAGQSVTVSVTYTPQGVGLTGGSIFVSGPALNIPITATGTAIGQLILAPSALNFGGVLVGETGQQAATLSATGGSVTISSAASSNSQFALSGPSFPLTIGAGQSVQFNVGFAPKSTGNASATLSFSSNASDSRLSEALAGTGTSPQVRLSWSASSSPVAGYNVYRGTKPGAYARINTALDTHTAFMDSTVVSGVTYYYAATGVSSSGEESTYSAPVQVAVP